MKVLISQHGPFLPIIKLLQAANLGIEWIGLQPPMAKMLQDIDIPCQPLAGMTTAEDQGKASNTAAHMLARAVMGKYPPDSHVHPAVLEFLHANLPGYLYPRLLDLTLLIQTVDRIHPDMVILHNDVEPLTRSVAAWAKQAGAPCLHIPHAIYLDSNWVGQSGTDVHDVITASHIAVAGPFQQAWYEQRLGKGQMVQINPTGLPQFDPWMHMPVNREIARQLFGLDQNRPVVVYASSWRQDTNLQGCHDGVEEAYGAFLEACHDFPGLQVIVKVHPRATNGQGHVEMAQKMGINCLITAQHLEMSLQAADALVAFGPSNVILEGAILGGMHLGSIEGFANDPEVATLKPEREEISNFIQNGLTHIPIPALNLVAKYCGMRDGRACERIAAWTQEILTQL